MHWLTFTVKTHPQNQISIFPPLPPYPYTFCLPRITKHKVIHEDRAGDYWAFTAVWAGAEGSRDLIYRNENEITICEMGLISWQRFLDASSVVRLYWSGGSVGCCWCTLPVSTSCSELGGGHHMSLAVSGAVGFSSSRMLHSLCELQDLVDGRVSHSSPVSVWTRALFVDEKRGVRMCKYSMSGDR